MHPVNIIWDWNGTLLNDLSLCISSINNLLGKRQLKLLDKNSYQEVFAFPVKDYYAAIGFDFSKEDFSVPAHEFIELYEAGVKRCTLHPDAVMVLSKFKDKGLKQYVLSAMQQDMLVKTLKQNHIFHFFEGIAGLDDHYAVSKLERGKLLFGEFGINKTNTCLVGDTLHDFEVAQALGIECILIADGHQSKERLNRTGTLVLDSLADILNAGFMP
jgi:phosphoglycolate phosphatase